MENACCHNVASQREMKSKCCPNDPLVVLEEECKDKDALLVGLMKHAVNTMSAEEQTTILGSPPSSIVHKSDARHSWVTNVMECHIQFTEMWSRPYFQVNKHARQKQRHQHHQKHLLRKATTKPYNPTLDESQLGAIAVSFISRSSCIAHSWSL